jgi:uridine kinase
VRRLESAEVILLEGILIFENSAVLSRLDLKIFVDTDADVRILRRLTRDVKERGRSLDSVVEQYLTTVKPMHEQYVEPSKKHADLILNGGMNPVALEIVAGRVKDFLENR